LADDKVLLVGVARDGSDNLAMIYDPAASTLTATGSHAPHSIFPNQADGYPTYSFAATALTNGNVLLVGGNDWDDSGFRDSAEIYDLATGEFHQTGRMTAAWQAGTATTLPGGRVLAGGDKYAALYDPASGTFASLFPPGNWGNAAMTLFDGTVLIAGAGSTYTEVWLYVPPPSPVSAASMVGPLAPDSLGTIFGARLAGVTAAADPQAPPTSIGGTSVWVRDSAGSVWIAPLLYVSPSQINFEVPADVVSGNITLTIFSGSDILSVATQVRQVAPGIFTLPGNLAAAYGTRIEPDGSQTFLPPGAPIVLDDRPVYLSLFGTGLRGRSSLDNVKATIGGIDVPVVYAGPGGGVAGLDQVNLLLPAALKGAGTVPLVLTVDGSAANQVLVDVR